MTCSQFHPQLTSANLYYGLVEPTQFGTTDKHSVEF